MSDFHITRELLRAVANGTVPARILAEMGWDHLSICPSCRGELEAWKQERTSPHGDDSAFRVLPAVLERHGREEGKRKKAAARDLRELLELPHDQCLRRIERATSRFRGTTLGKMLLAEAKRHMPAEPARAHELAESARAVALRSPASPGIVDVHAQAAASLGNALRANGRLREAEGHFREARGFIRHHGVTDPLVYAEVDWLEGVLRKDQRRFAEAEELLARSVAFYHLAGEAAEAARPLLALGALYYHRHDLDKAMDVTRAALQSVTAESEPFLYCSARHNLTLYLAESGRYAEAAEALGAHRELYGRCPDPWTQARLVWLEGKIAQGLGRPDEAERAYVEVRESFITQRVGYDAAMVTLDLALLYLKAGRTAEVRRLADETHRLFEAEDIHREAAAALLLFEEAARREALSVEVAEELAAYLEKARGNPTLRFQRRSG